MVRDNSSAVNAVRCSAAPAVSCSMIGWSWMPGTVGSRLYLEEQQRIQVVLLTHLHFDHIRELPTLADNLVGEIDEPVIIAAIPEVLDGLRRHIFNGVVYPDFSSCPTPPNRSSCPVSCARTETQLCGFGVTPIRVNHVVPTVGFLLRDEGPDAAL